MLFYLQTLKVRVQTKGCLFIFSPLVVDVFQQNKSLRMMNAVSRVPLSFDNALY